jgi:hypothetical protein
MPKHIKDPIKYFQEFFKRWVNNMMEGQSIDEAMEIASQTTKDEFVFDLTTEAADWLINLIFKK